MFCFSFSGDSRCFSLAERRKVRVCSSSFSSANHLISFFSGDVSSVNYRGIVGSWDRERVAVSC